MYAWWCSLCVWEKGEVFATESTAEELFATDTHGRSRTKSSLSLSVRVCEGPWPKKTKTRLLTLINAKVQCLSLAGLRTQGREPCGSALRGDFPVGAPGYLLSRLWLSERFTVKAQLCSKAGAFQKVATPIVKRSESPEGRALKAAPAVLRLLPRAKAIGGEPRLASAAFRARRGDSGGNQGLLASVFMPRSFPNTAARQFRILTGFPTT